MYVGHMRAWYLQRSERALISGYCSCRWLGATRWVLGTEPGSSARAVSALNHWTISSVHVCSLTEFRSRLNSQCFAFELIQIECIFIKYWLYGKHCARHNIVEDISMRRLESFLLGLYLHMHSAYVCVGVHMSGSQRFILLFKTSSVQWAETHQLG